MPFLIYSWTWNNMYIKCVVIETILEPLIPPKNLFQVNDYLELASFTFNTCCPHPSVDMRFACDMRREETIVWTCKHEITCHISSALFKSRSTISMPRYTHLRFIFGIWYDHKKCYFWYLLINFCKQWTDLIW